jgi:hypothetical protein
VVDPVVTDLVAHGAVHAPTFGETVKISRIDAIGPITVIRRMMR